MTHDLDTRISKALHAVAADIRTDLGALEAIQRREAPSSPADSGRHDTTQRGRASQGTSEQMYVLERSRPRRRRLPATVGAAAVVLGLGMFVAGRGIVDDRQTDTPATAGSVVGSTGAQGEGDSEVEARVAGEIAAFEATMGEPIVIANGVDPVHGEWAVSVRISGESLTNGFCITRTSGESCGVGADLELFGLFSRAGRPVPIVVWGAPMPITTVRVEWDDGTTEAIDVVRPPGEAFGFAAAVMPSADTEFTSDALDEGGAVVVSGITASNPQERVEP
jgi:hypothetical protein